MPCRVWSRAGEAALRLLFAVRSFLGQVGKWCITGSCCWTPPQAGGRAEEAREKAVGTGLERELRERRASGRAPWVRTIPPGLHEPTRQTCFRWGDSRSFPPACEVFARTQVSYLGRVDEVQEQLAWGSAKVYLEMALCGPPTSH